MDYQSFNNQLFAGFVLAILLLGGCAPETQTQKRVCTGKRTAGELLSLLNSRPENMAPLKASGNCFLQYYTEENKLKKENFPVKVWVNPPVELYIQGDVAFNPKGITIGSNKHEFWVAMKPKKISSYWWGEWSEGNRLERLMVNPKLILEATGAVSIENEKNWSLSHNESFDILTKQQGKIKIKKIYTDKCDYLVRKVEYLDYDGEVAIAMELDKYKEPVSGFFIPSFIKITNYLDGSEKNSIQITLGSVKSTDFTEKQQQFLFIRPEPEGFENIYKIIGGDIIEQSSK